MKGSKSTKPYTPTERKVADRLARRRLLPIVRESELVKMLWYKPRGVAQVILHPEEHYRIFYIQKKGRGRRRICAPKDMLLDIQLVLHREIFTKQSVHPAACAFVRGKSVLDCAAPHKQKKYLWNIDLKDFFDHISTAQVLKVLTGLGYPPKVADLLSRLCTYKNALPQGAPTSPALSNLVFRNTDKQLKRVCTVKKVTYTRYADDLSFSSNKPFTIEFFAKVESILNRHGFQINPFKNRLVGPGGQRKVTGLVVNKQISVPRKFRRQVRTACHQFDKEPKKHENKYHILAGLVHWIKRFHKEEGKAYQRLLNKAASRE